MISNSIKEAISAIKLLRKIGFSVLPEKVSQETKDFISFVRRRDPFNSKHDLTYRNDSIYMAYDYIQRTWEGASWQKIIAEVYVCDEQLFGLIDKSDLY